MLPNAKCRAIALYLPQFHPIPENDAWWGKGFTEWTNVAKARPLFRGHEQPHIPADLGFYDLRVPETRVAQAQLARDAGIEAFCYWHYWFAGKRLLERPFNEVLASGEPDFPFCLGWANQTWTGIWHGAPGRILMEQTYPGVSDYEAHFQALLPAFTDPRYVSVDGKPLFIVFRALELPEPREFTDCWRRLAEKAGLPGIHFVALSGPTWQPESCGFDASFVGRIYTTALSAHRGAVILDVLLERTLRKWKESARRRPVVLSYKQVVDRAFMLESDRPNRYPVVVPNWDNTPRCGNRGVVFTGATPKLLGQYVRAAIAKVSDRDPEHRIIIIKSWNEWAEGNYVEPDLQSGTERLRVLRSEILD